MRRILLVEDDAAHAELIQRAFEGVSEAAEIVWASTLAEARQALAGPLPCLALADYRLPDGFGTSLVSLADGRFPVVLLTSYGSERLAVDSIKGGALDYIVKSPEMFAEMPHLASRACREWEHIQQRHRAERALRDSELRFHRLLEGSPHVAVQGLDANGRVIYWNHASELILHRPASEALGQDYADLVIPPEERAAFRQGLAEMATTGQPMKAAESELLRPDNTRVPIAMSYVVLDSPDASRQLFAIGMDLTERKRAEAVHLEMERRLLHTQKLESLGVLAGGIAHDFNNLLTTILGNLGLARSDLPRSNPVQSLLAEAESATHRAADLTRQMLAYSGRGHFHITNVDLSELVNEMARLLAASISKTAVLRLRLDRALPCIRADRTQLQQVVMNLITNASEAIGDRGGTITLTTGQQVCSSADLAESRLDEKPPPGRYVFLEATDTGCGMDAAVQDRIFEPFFTTKFTGRGLGMASVLGVIRGHQGAITVSSRLHEGTRIRVLFPALETSPEAPPQGTHPKAMNRQAPALTPARETLLVVDDEPQVRALASQVLSRAGYRVLLACDGEEGMLLFRERLGEIDGVLLDLAMPKKDGLHVLEAMRVLRPNLPAVLLSGYGKPEVQGRLPITDESTAFLQKPYEIPVLLREVQRMFNPPQARNLPPLPPPLPQGRH